MLMRIEDIRINVVRSNRKTVSIEVTPSGDVLVRAPEDVSINSLKNFVSKHRTWIVSKLGKVRERKRYLGKRGFKNGVPFFFLGKSYPLKIVSSHLPLELRGGMFFLSSSYLQHARDIFISWYKKVGLPYVVRRVEFFTGEIFRFKGVKITRAEKRWGSCSRKNGLCFSYRVLMLPEEIIDYVVVHEIAHIREKNHSKRFWDLVESLLPDFRERDRWLKVNGWKFVL
ncbi:MULTISPECIES: SprT family zinc-dependent metalloprotease [unclassified Desulfurobacterium]|uniref:M48 family metallopeptidase n=1 Tax=unclassified Desulfurobacterium TaxID=2639089 RepID=UPI0003B454BB|nr:MULTISPECIES: SprT family zinc-dependent metalloprotease [unclassified Desulfurobacterium]